MERRVFSTIFRILASESWFIRTCIAPLCSTEGQMSIKIFQQCGSARLLADSGARPMAVLDIFATRQVVKACVGPEVGSWNVRVKTQHSGPVPGFEIE